MILGLIIGAFFGTIGGFLLAAIFTVGGRADEQQMKFK